MSITRKLRSRQLALATYEMVLNDFTTLKITDILSYENKSVRCELDSPTEGSVDQRKAQLTKVDKLEFAYTLKMG